MAAAGVSELDGTPLTPEEIAALCYELGRAQGALATIRMRSSKGSVAWSLACRYFQTPTLSSLTARLRELAKGLELPP
jgi:hypothetical protein